jgi:hypothetical protein
MRNYRLLTMLTAFSLAGGLATPRCDAAASAQSAPDGSKHAATGLDSRALGGLRWRLIFIA